MITFRVPEAADYLLRYSIVYTIRRAREEGWQELFIGRDHHGRCHVQLVGKITDELLEKHLGESGFGTLAQWKTAAVKVHGDDPNNLLLYRVTMGRER